MIDKLEIDIMEANNERHRIRLENELIDLHKHGGEKYEQIIMNCRKNIEIDRRIGNILRGFFDDLEINEYLRETEPLRMMIEVMSRNTATLQIIIGIGNPFLQNESSRFKELLKDQNFDDDAFTILYVTLVVHLWLDQTEFFKNMLLTVLNDKARNECGIKDKDPLGRLLNKLGKKIAVDDFRNVIKPDFRNILGHSKWWMDGDNFCYQDKSNEIIVLHKLEFHSLFIHITTLTLQFIAILYEYYLMP